MKLYFSPGACSLSPHIALLEAGLEFTTGTGRHARQANRRAAPTSWRSIRKAMCRHWRLKDGAVLTEGPAIVQFIADLAPDRQLAPANGTLERYQPDVEWLSFISTEVHKIFSPLFRPNRPRT